MRTRKLGYVLSAMVLITGLAQAQIAVDPNNDSCWDSLSSLRSCEKLEVERAAIQAQQCTSFPEYQCTPETTPAASSVEVKKPKKSEVTAGVSSFQPHTDEELVVKPPEPVGNQR